MKIYSPDINNLKQNHLLLVQQLRPHINDIETMQIAMNELKKSNVFILFAEENNIPIAFVSFRMMYNLYLQFHCVVDDLVVLDTQRGGGIGSKLLHEIERICKENKVLIIKLDSGLQRIQAHEFYEKNGFTRKCFTFEKRI